MHYRLLGPLEVFSDDGTQVPISGERERVLLATLLLGANRVVSSGRLIEAVWGDQEPSTARNTLQVHVSRLRRKLADAAGGESPLRTSSPGYVLTVAAGELDVQVVESLLEGAHGEPQVAALRLREALALWRGSALVDVDSMLLVGDRIRLDEQHAATVERRIDADLACGRHLEVIAELEALIHSDPLSESLPRQLMLALYRAGRQADALACYKDVRKRLAEVLGVDPGPELQALELAILQHDEAIAAPTTHFVPHVLNHNLPVVLTTFHGREREVDKVRHLLGRHRLVTVVGPGGVGKSRLAMEVAASITSRFNDGVRLVELAQIDDPEGVPRAAAEVFEVRANSGVTIAESLAAVIGSRHALIVLDNCEHVIEGAAALCSTLLQSGEDLRILATSREPLQISGEACFPLSPLDVPSANESIEQAGERDAVALFVERAGRGDPEFELSPESIGLVSELVRHLDGMPLAIELAAAQIGALGLDRLVLSLDDGFKYLVSTTRGVAIRQSSLEATVEWSYRLLDQDERQTFRRLAVFPAPFTLEAATAVAGAGSEERVLRLVRRSLLTAPRPGADGRSRYRMLGTVRAFSLARLDGEGERREAEWAMATWVLHETERIAQSFDGPDDGQAGRWGDAEQDNLREAWKTLQEGDGREALRLAIAMGPWALLRGHYAVGRRMLEHGLSALSGEDPDLVATAELWLGRLGNYSSDFVSGLESLRRAEAIWRSRSTKRELVDTLTIETWVLMNLGHTEKAREVGMEALALSEELEYATGIIYSLVALNVVESYVGDNAAAVDLARRALAIDLDHCAGHAKRYALTTSALSLGLAGEVEWAERLLTECLALCREAGDRAWELMQLESLARIEFKTGRTEQAGLHLAEATRISVETGESLKLADCLATAAVLVAEHQPERAAVLWGAGRAVAETMGDYRVAIADITDRADVMSAEDSAFMTAPMLSVRERLGLDAVRGADERGAAMRMEAVLELVRGATTEGLTPAGTSERLGPGLGKRERELVDLVAQGLTDADIAERLFISIHTVRSDLDRIEDKT